MFVQQCLYPFTGQRGLGGQHRDASGPAGGGSRLDGRFHADDGNGQVLAQRGTAAVVAVLQATTSKLAPWLCR
jgi:hypothetical protein